jgi:hypothetical protein
MRRTRAPILSIGSGAHSHDHAGGREACGRAEGRKRPPADERVPRRPRQASRENFCNASVSSPLAQRESLWILRPN